LLASAAVVALAPAAHAQTASWAGGFSNDWTASGNWIWAGGGSGVPGDPAGTPTPGVIIGTQAPNPTVVDLSVFGGSTVTLGSLAVGNGTGTNGNLTATVPAGDPGRTLGIQTGLLIGTNGGTGTVTLGIGDGAQGLTLSSDGAIEIGTGGGAGTVTVNMGQNAGNAGITSAGAFSIGTGAGSTGTVTVNMGTGAQNLTVGSGADFSIGTNGGTANVALNIVQNAFGVNINSAGAFLVGTDGGTGNVAVTVGDGASDVSIRNTGAIAVGDAGGHGTLDITLGANVSGFAFGAPAAGALSIGTNGGTGDVTLTIGEFNQNITLDALANGTLAIGTGGGTGRLTINTNSDLSILNNDAIRIGAGASSNGTMTVNMGTGGNLNLSGSGTLSIGSDGGTGALAINVANGPAGANTNLSFDSIAIGTNTGRGSLAITLGAGSNLNNLTVSGRVAIGTDGGTGDMTVTLGDRNATTVLFTSGLAIGTGGGQGTLTFNMPDEGAQVVNLPSAPPQIGVGPGSVANIRVLGSGKAISQQDASILNSTLGIAVNNLPELVFGDQGGSATVTNSAGFGLQVGSTTNQVVFGRGGGSGTLHVLGGGKGALFAMSSFVPLQYLFGDGDGSTGTLLIEGTANGAPSRVSLISGKTIFGNAGGTGIARVLGGGKLLTAPGSCPGGPMTCPTGIPDPQLGVDGGTGSVTVSGPGSVWYVMGRTNSNSAPPGFGTPGEIGNLYVGGSGGGTGVLTIADGGVIKLGQGYFTQVNDQMTGGFHRELDPASFTTGLGTVFVAQEVGSTGTVNFGAPAGSVAVAPGTLEAAAIQFGAGDGRIVFNHTATDFTFHIPTSGPGAVQTLSGTTIFDTPGALTYTGPTLVDGGILRAGAVDVMAPSSEVRVGAAGTFDLAGFDQTVPGLTNAGLVRLNTPGAAPGTVLTVAGNYVGQGGTVALNTVLGGDGSASDRLVINGGRASGDSILRITNVGGAGAATVQGIQVVQTANSGSSDANAFRLNTRITAGAYEYQLRQVGQDWYLQSFVPPPPPPPPEDGGGGTTPPGNGGGPTSPDNGGGPAAPAGPVIPSYRPEAALYAPIPAIARQMGLASLGTLHERVGEEESLRDLTGSSPYANGAWARSFGERSRNRWDGTVDARATGDIFGIQAGFDILRTRPYAGGHRDQAGVYVAYTNYNAPSVSGFALGVQNLRVGRLLMEGPSVGAYWTHFGPSGWYVDAVFQASWYDITARSDYGTSLGTNATGYTASLEAGYPIRFGAGNRWQVEPQAQILYQSLSVDRSRDALSAVDWDEGDAWTGRLGARLQYTGRTPEALWQPYAKVNLWHAFSGNDRVSFGAGAPVQSRFGDTALEVGAGITARVSQNLSFYGNADYRWSLGGDRGRQTAVQGTIGIRLNW
jgi:outer membrane autotransporter protein